MTVEDINKEIEEFEKLIMAIQKAREEIDKDPKFLDLIIDKQANTG